MVKSTSRAAFPGMRIGSDGGFQDSRKISLIRYTSLGTETVTYYESSNKALSSGVVAFDGSTIYLNGSLSPTTKKTYNVRSNIESQKSVAGLS